MKIDKTTYKNKEENQIVLTADQNSQPYDDLFFPNSKFLHVENLHTNSKLSFPKHSSKIFKKAKEPFFPSLDINNNQINFKLISYGNN